MTTTDPSTTTSGTTTPTTSDTTSSTSPSTDTTASAPTMSPTAPTTETITTAEPPAEPAPAVDAANAYDVRPGQFPMTFSEYAKQSKVNPVLLAGFKVSLGAQAASSLFNENWEALLNVYKNKPIL